MPPRNAANNTTSSLPGARPAPHHALLANPTIEARGHRLGVPRRQPPRKAADAKLPAVFAASSPRTTFGGRGRRHRGLASGSGGEAARREIGRRRRF
jgi:hypothetical protein